jgi:putative intracellular protease/amidase
MLLVRAISAILAAVPFAIALPEQPTNVNVTGKPTHYAMLVFPGFQPLDVYGPLDVIAGLPMAGVNQPLHLSILSRTLEPVSSIAPPHATNMSHGNFGHSIVPTARFKDVLEKPCPDKGEIDVLFVPGGIGTRADVAEEIAFVKEMFPRVIEPLSDLPGTLV